MNTSQVPTETNRDAADKVVQQLVRMPSENHEQLVRELITKHGDRAREVLHAAHEQLRAEIQQDVEVATKDFIQAYRHTYRTASQLGVVAVKTTFAHGSDISEPLHNYDRDYDLEDTSEELADAVVFALLPLPKLPYISAETYSAVLGSLPEDE